MRLVGMRPVVVHGGGPQISDADEPARQGDRVPRRPAGHRRRDRRHRPHGAASARSTRSSSRPSTSTARYAVGVSGEDAGLIRAVARDPELGFVGDVDDDQPGDPRAAARRGAHPGRRHDRHRRAGPGVQHQRRHRRRRDRRGARRREARLPHRHRGPAPRRRRPGQPDPPDDGRRARRADRRRHDRRRDDPEGRRAASHAVRNGVRRAHILDGRIAHVLLLELFTDAGIGTMVTDPSTDRRSTDERPRVRHRRLDACPFMPVFGAAAGHVRRGARAPSCGTPTASATSTSSAASPSRRSATPTRRSPRRSPSRPATLLHVSQPLRQPGRPPRRPSTLDRAARSTPPGHGGQVFFTNSGAEANECAIKLARKYGGRGRHVGGQRLRQLPRPHAGHARRHRPAGEARAVPAAARGLPPRRLGRPRRARRGRRRRRSPRCCSSRCRARAASTRRPPSYLRGDPRSCATSAALLMMVDEVQTGLGRTGRVVRLRARRRRARRRHAGQGARQRHADRRLLGPARGRRGVRARRPRHARTAATPLATAAVSAVIAEMRRIDAPAAGRASRARG